MLGALIGDYIKSKGITQVKVAADAGISSQTLNDIIHGRRRIEVTEYFSICKALGCSINYFYDQMFDSTRSA